MSEKAPKVNPQEIDDIVNIDSNGKARRPDGKFMSQYEVEQVVAHADLIRDNLSNENQETPQPENPEGPNGDIPAVEVVPYEPPQSPEKVEIESPEEDIIDAEVVEEDPEQEQTTEITPEQEQIIQEATALIDDFDSRLELADAVHGKNKRPVALGRLAKEYVKYAKKYAGIEVLRNEFLECAERAVDTIRNSEEHSSIRARISGSKKEADRIKRVIVREITKISQGMEDDARNDTVEKAIEMATSIEKSDRKNSALLLIARQAGDISPIEHVSHPLPWKEKKIKGKAYHDAINKARDGEVMDQGMGLDILDAAEDIEDDYWRIKTRLAIAIRRKDSELLLEVKDEVKGKYSNHDPIYRKLMKAYDRAERKVNTATS